MSHYSYLIATEEGKKIRGRLCAQSVDEAVEKLKKKNHIILKIKEIKKSSVQALSRKERAVFARELSELLNSALPLFECLQSLAEKHQGTKLGQTFTALSEKIQTGSTLSNALDTHFTHFDPIALAMVRAAEASGDLGNTLARYAKLQERELKLRRELSSALIYPALLAVLSLALLVLFLLFLVPSLEELFEGKHNSALTAFVFALSHSLRHLWPLFIAFTGAAVAGFTYSFRSFACRARLEKLILKIRGVKRLYLDAKWMRLTRLLAVLLEGKISLVTALQLSRATLGSQLLQKQLQKVEQGLIRGERFSSELKNCPHFPPLFIRMVALGEERGAMAEMMKRLSMLYEEEVEKRLRYVTTLLPPLMLLMMGIWIAIIVMAILMPLTDVSTFIVD